MKIAVGPAGSGTVGLSEKVFAAAGMDIDKDIQRLKALLIAEMGTSCTAVCEQEGVNYTVTYTPVRKSIIDKDNLLRLKLEHPDIYEQFVTVSESRRFSVRASIMEAA